MYYPDSPPHKSTDPLFITLFGEENSLYSIVLSFFRESEINPSRDKKDVFNYITIPENVEQELTIQPEAVLVIKLEPNMHEYRFMYSSGYPVSLCARANGDKLPVDPNCDFKIENSNYSLTKLNSVFIGIQNLNNKIATIKIKYITPFTC